MKKVVVAILAFVYITTSDGANVHMYYCMGKLAAWDLGQNKAKTCAVCGMQKTDGKDNGCCRDEHKFVKNNADQKTGETVSYPVMHISVVLPASFNEIYTTDFPAVTKEDSVKHVPPRRTGVAVYVRNCVFLI